MGNTGSTGSSNPPRPHFDRRGHGLPPPYYHRYPPWPPSAAAPPPVPVPAQVERHRAVAVHAGVNVKGDTLRLVPDDDGRCLLLAFSFDADAPGSITVYFFAQEDDDHVLKATKENVLQPVKITFKEGQGQEFKQPSGTGINVSMFEESELTKVGEDGVFPVAFKVEVGISSNQESEREHDAEDSKSLVKFAVFVKKEKAEYGVRVVQQIMWVNGTRYVLQEIYGIRNTTDKNVPEDDFGKECVVCLSEPRDTTVLPCRHMVLREQCNVDMAPVVTMWERKSRTIWRKGGVWNNMISMPHARSSSKFSIRIAHSYSLRNLLSRHWSKISFHYEESSLSLAIKLVTAIHSFSSKFLHCMQFWQRCIAKCQVLLPSSPKK